MWWESHFKHRDRDTEEPSQHDMEHHNKQPSSCVSEPHGHLDHSRSTHGCENVHAIVYQNIYFIRLDVSCALLF